MMCVVSSLEEMCDLMCDNKVPEEKPQTWTFTFGFGQEHEGKYVKIKGTYAGARNKMMELYGDKWAFQYSEAEWSAWEDRRPAYIVETLLEEVNAEDNISSDDVDNGVNPSVCRGTALDHVDAGRHRD